MKRLTPEQKADIVTRARAGQYLVPISRAVGCSTYSVMHYSRAAGVTVQKVPGSVHAANARKSNPVKYVPMTKPVASAESEWRAKAYASRRFGGSGYPT